MRTPWLLLLLLPPLTLQAAGSPNVVLITLDTTRQDALSCYGQQGSTTPNLDWLARISHQFLDAYTPVPQTLPAHASLLTGLEPFEHGLRDNFQASLDPGTPTMASVLKAKGYRTAAVIGAVVLNGRFGLGRGFDEYDDAIQDPSGCRRAGEVTQLAMKALDGMKPPFFLWVHYYDPHFPYDAPGPAAASPYLGEVRYMDDQMAPLLRRLDPASTVIIAAGDHGEMLGEHREEEHGILLYEGAVRVPLLIHLPGQTGRQAHPGAVSLSAVFSTVLDAVGPPGKPARSKPSLLAGGAKPPVYLETLHPFLGYGWSPLRGLIRGGHKLIASLGESELYLLREDPLERTNVADREPALAKKMKGMLESVCPEQSLIPPAPKEATIPHDIQKQIESLGYLGGGRTGSRPDGAVLHPREVVDIVFFLMRRAPRMLLETGQERAVLAEAKLALKRDPANASLYHVAGTACMQMGDLDRAQDIFREGLKIAPSLPALLGGMGRCLQLMGRRDEAEQYFKRAITGNPFQTTFYAYLAQLYLEESKPELAQATVDAAKREGRSSAGLVFIDGMLALSRGSYPQAIQAFEEALRHEPGMLDAIERLAYCYYQTRDYPKAWDALQRGLKRKPDDFRMGRQAFELALRMNRKAEARSIAARFVASHPMTEEARAMREIFPDLP